ncbi:DUF4328 domain-containing protein [Streptomyces sp. NPDC059398]|uniref:DUF4328 domain-containing protein n=1 Tax=Streptomyces sp. NPDC059398 TaxID=3346820 RepID=UPI00369568D4
MSHTPAFAPPRDLYIGPRWRPTRGLSLAVTLLLALCAAADVLSAVAHINMYSLLGNVSDDGFASYTVAEGQRADRLADLSSGLYLMALAATAVVFIIWFHRARKNAAVFAPDIQGRKAGWAIGGWFVPLGSLWIPHGIASASWDASSPTAPDGSRRPAPRTLLTAWWTAWVLSLVLSNLDSALSRSDDPGLYRQSVAVMLAGDAVDLVAAVLAIFFVRKLTLMQHTKAAEGPYATV